MPHEIIVWYVLPALRRELVIELKKMQIPQKDIAKLMKLTQAAVSQYMHNKRGSKEVSFSKTLHSEIKASAKRIRASKERDVLMKELVRLVDLSMKEKIICRKCRLKKGKCDICSLRH